MERGLVSIIIPTKNSDRFLANLLESIKKQSYKKIETIIVDGYSTDNTIAISKRYKVKIINFVPKVSRGTFDAPHKRNYGVKKSRGEFVYYVDADMVLSSNLVKEAASMMDKFDALILPEDSFGEGIWASAKNLERRCYWGDDTVEAPRFFKKEVWLSVGGLDESLGGGGDDWDIYQKLKDKKFRVGRTHAIVRHNEGKLELFKLLKKRFMYGRDSVKYISKRPKAGVKNYFPIRAAYIRNWRLFVNRPKDTLAFIVMRSAEYTSGFCGVVFSAINR